MENITKPQSLYWVGPRRSDIIGIEDMFRGAVVLIGESEVGKFNCKSLESISGIRINHNLGVLSEKIGKFYNETTKAILKSDSAAVFLWYGSPPQDISRSVRNASPYLNCTNLNDLLADKFQTRKLFSGKVPLIPYTLRTRSECSIESLRVAFPGYDSFVLQDRIGSGGYSTTILRHSENDLSPGILVGEDIIVSPYIEHLASVNVHALISAQGIAILPPSVQIHLEVDHRFLYLGGDFAAAGDLENHHFQEINKVCLDVCEILKTLGYKGVVGIDLLVCNNDAILLVEVNARFQGSTTALNLGLLDAGLSSVQEQHMSCFSPHYYPKKVKGLIKHYSCVSKILENDCHEITIKDHSIQYSSPDLRNTNFSNGRISYRVLTDGAHKVNFLHRHSQSMRVFFSGAVMGMDYRGAMTLQPSVVHMVSNSNFCKQITRGDIGGLMRLKCDLLVYGARLSSEAKKSIKRIRGDKITIRDGIAGGLDISLFKDIFVNVPIKEKFALISPYSIDIDNNIFILSYNQKHLLPINIVQKAIYIGKTTLSGTAFEDIGQIFTDRLGISPYPNCRNNKKNNTACHFCEIGNQDLSHLPRNPDDIFEVVKWCNDNMQSVVRHILISGGTPPKGEWLNYIRIIKQIRTITSLRIYSMIEPIKSFDILNGLRDAGVDEIGMNIEIFDRNIAKEIMPGKSQHSLDYYMEALSNAKQTWRDCGAVRSILIVGLEDPESTLRGVEALCDIGVMPILSPFRPIPGTPLEHRVPPSSRLLVSVWKEAQSICERHKLTLGPTCVCCLNNTVAIPCNGTYSLY